jgi:Ras family protein T1
MDTNGLTEGVGKSTIVTSLIKESFVAQVRNSTGIMMFVAYRSIQVQHIVPEVTIPPEVTPENVTTYIVDSGCKFPVQRACFAHFVFCVGGPQDQQHLEAEIRKAHVICIVYSIDNPNSFDRIPTYWLPYFRQLGVNVPVILVGNKIDLRGGEVTNEALEDEIVPIMNEFKVPGLHIVVFQLDSDWSYA